DKRFCPLKLTEWTVHSPVRGVPALREPPWKRTPRRRYNAVVPRSRQLETPAMDAPCARRVVRIRAISLAAIAPPAAVADCPYYQWQPGDGLPGTDGSVYALTVYNGNMIAGGSFTIAGGVIANSIAQWNGTSWRPLGSGMGGIFPTVDALSVYNG